MKTTDITTMSGSEIRAEIIARYSDKYESIKAPLVAPWGDWKPEGSPCWTSPDAALMLEMLITGRDYA